jgi:outer membrane protein assembly factor BamB
LRAFFNSVLLFIAAEIGCLQAGASDWPQLLGPNRNGVSGETNLNLTWGADGPAKLWQKPVGRGFSGPAVAGGKLVLFHRVGNRETVEACNALTGAGLWKYDYAATYRDDFGFDPGPRATPTIAGGKAFTYGADGILSALNFEDGKLLWSEDCKAKFGSRKGYFGRACSPLIEGKKLILEVGGGEGNGIMAFDIESGKVEWKATDDEAGYSSPVAATLGRRRYLFAFTRTGLATLNPDSGSVFSQFRWRSPMDASVNAATPLVIGDTVFLSASYDTGCTALRMKEGKPEALWSLDDGLSNHYATSIYRDGYLYGFNGRQDIPPGPRLSCVDYQTGKLAWSEEPFGAGSLILAGDRLLILTEKGELMVSAPSPKEFKVTSRAQVFPFEVRAFPALADGLFYARSKNQLICLDLRRACAASVAR